MKTVVASAAVLTSAALVLPALAQTGTEADGDESSTTEMDDTGYASSSDTAAEEADDTAAGSATGTTGIDAAMDEDTGTQADAAAATGGTIPRELPATGGGFGARRP